ncbi:MAG: GspH/FimT family pseudopilin [Acidobacteria bacterium]|nr:GspH/FimT family pseudopilin [Acidobacteriota bacterium]
MRHSGYSLIESLAVLGISGLLFLSAAPSVLSMYDHWKLQNEAVRLAAVLEQARLHAILANTSVRFTTSGRKYLVGISGFEPRSFLLNAGTQFPAGSKSVVFSSRGTASPGATFTLASRSREVSVVVSPAGRIRIAL